MAELGGSRGRGLTADDKVVLGRADSAKLKQAKREHRETTAVAQRALRKVQQTEAVAAQTAAELYSQTGQLERTAGKLGQMQEDVKQSRGALRYLSLMCVCFGKDPTAEPPAATPEVSYVVEGADQKGADPGAEEGEGEEGVATASGRNVLGVPVPAKGPKKLKDLGEAKPLAVAGAGDLREIALETGKQDAALGQISDALGRLQGLSEDMGAEIEKQTAIVADIQRGADRVDAELLDISQTGRLKKVKLKKKKKSGSGVRKKP